MKKINAAKAVCYKVEAKCVTIDTMVLATMDAMYGDGWFINGSSNAGLTLCSGRSRYREETEPGFCCLKNDTKVLKRYPAPERAPEGFF